MKTIVYMPEEREPELMYKHFDGEGAVDDLLPGYLKRRFISFFKINLDPKMIFRNFVLVNLQRMHDYIFYTEEGFCQAPDNSEVENFQILGFERGDNPTEAFDFLIENNPWIFDKGYSKENILHKEVVY